MAIKGKKKSTRRKLKKSKSVHLLTGSNLSILLLGIVSVVFIASIINRHMRGGMTIQDFSNDVKNPSPLNTKYEHHISKLSMVLKDVAHEGNCRTPHIMRSTLISGQDIPASRH